MWKPRQLPSDFRQTVESIFEPMAESAKPAFDETNLCSLYSLVALTAEFHIYLNAKIDLPNEADIDYMCGSIFSGIEPFLEVNHTYNVLVGSITSKIKWDSVAKNFLKEQFFSMYDEFSLEVVFEKKCRLLLDLFKLQIVFAGMSC